MWCSKISPSVLKDTSSPLNVTLTGWSSVRRCICPSTKAITRSDSRWIVIDIAFPLGNLSPNPSEMLFVAVPLTWNADFGTGQLSLSDMYCIVVFMASKQTRLTHTLPTTNMLIPCSFCFTSCPVRVNLKECGRSRMMSSNCTRSCEALRFWSDNRLLRTAETLRAKLICVSICFAIRTSLLTSPFGFLDENAVRAIRIELEKFFAKFTQACIFCGISGKNACASSKTLSSSRMRNFRFVSERLALAVLSTWSCLPPVTSRRIAKKIGWFLEGVITEFSGVPSKGLYVLSSITNIPWLIAQRVFWREPNEDKIKIIKLVLIKIRFTYIHWRFFRVEVLVII